MQTGNHSSVPPTHMHTYTHTHTHTLTESSLAPPFKIILTGPKSKTLHKEELTASEAEKKVKKRIEENAK